MRIGVIVCAGGRSIRYAGVAGDPLAGGGRSKLDEDLGGRPVLQRSVELFTTLETRADLGLGGGAAAEIAAVVVCGPEEEAAFAEFGLRHADRLALLGARLVRGGSTRAASVKAGLDALAETEGVTHAMVHDAARAITPTSVIERVVRAAARHGAAAPGLPVPDTIKRIGSEVDAGPADPLAGILGDDAGGPAARVVVETVPRDDLVLVQTPQCFEIALLRRAYEQSGFMDATDDAGLVERLGERVVVVEGDPANVKLTRAADLRVVRVLGGFQETEGRATHKRF